MRKKAREPRKILEELRDEVFKGLGVPQIVKWLDKSLKRLLRTVTNWWYGINGHD